METESQPRKGSSNVLEKLEKSVAAGDFYEAQQMYKTLYFRHLNSKKFADAIALMKSGACVMLQHGHVNEGTELANLLINIYNQIHAKVDKEHLEPLATIFSMYKDSTEAMQAKESFIKTAIKWSIAEGNNKQGSPDLHNLMAESFAARAEYGKAQKHFVRGNNPQAFAKMLIEWSENTYPSEKDLVIARAVLQYLTLGNLKDANTVFEIFLQQPSLPQTPLINFIRFLLLTLERDAYPLFDMLRKKYKPSIDRDPSFQQFLDQVGLVFFKVKPTGSQNFLSDFLKSFMGGQE